MIKIPQLQRIIDASPMLHLKGFVRIYITQAAENELTVLINLIISIYHLNIRINLFCTDIYYKVRFFLLYNKCNPNYSFCHFKQTSAEEEPSSEVVGVSAYADEG